MNRRACASPLGATVEENVSLKVGQARGEEITVVGEGAVVDTQTNQVSTNYDKDWVRNAPVRRFTFFDLINAAPGVNASATGSSRSTSFGSGTTENSYHARRHRLHRAPDRRGLALAQHRRHRGDRGAVARRPRRVRQPAGAVFNVVTRQGGNAFHGDANFYYQTQGLTGRNTTDAQDDGLPLQPRQVPRRARSSSAAPSSRTSSGSSARTSTSGTTESQPGRRPAFPAKFDADRIFFKLNYQINAKNRLMFAYHDDYYDIPGATPRPPSRPAR